MSTRFFSSRHRSSGMLSPALPVKPIWSLSNTARGEIREYLGLLPHTAKLTNNVGGGSLSQHKRMS